MKKPTVSSGELKIAVRTVTKDLIAVLIKDFAEDKPINHERLQRSLDRAKAIQGELDRRGKKS